MGTVTKLPDPPVAPQSQKRRRGRLPANVVSIKRGQKLSRNVATAELEYASQGRRLPLEMMLAIEQLARTFGEAERITQFVMQQAWDFR